MNLNRQTLSVMHCMHPDRPHPDQTPYAIHGVHVDKTGFTATDGNVMAHVTHNGDERLDVTERTLDGDGVKVAYKHVGAKGELTLDDTGTTAQLDGLHNRDTVETATGPKGNVNFPQLEGHFPAYADVLPTGERSTVGIDLVCLEKVVKAARAFFGSHRKDDPANVIRLTFDAKEPGAVAVAFDAKDAETGRTFTGLLMPLSL